MFLGDKMKGLSWQFVTLALLVVFTSGGLSWQVNNNSKALAIVVPEVKKIREVQLVVETTVANHEVRILECEAERKELSSNIYLNKENISVLNGWVANIKRLKMFGDG